MKQSVLLQKLYTMEAKLIAIFLIVFLELFNALPISEDAVNKGDNGHNGEYGEYFEGDMMLSYEQMSSILYPNKRNGEIGDKYRWPGNIVFYEIDSVFNEEHVKHIKKAMHKIEEVSCVRFKPRTKTTKDYVHVTGEDSGCRSFVGRHGSKQRLNLAISPIGLECFRLGSTIHEFIHALGFYHQQSASNRDDYVTIIEENIEDGHYRNFIKYTKSMVTDFGVPYDYGSIMHYSAYAFSKNGKVTIATHDKSAKIGQRDGMSPSDIKKINLMYKCPQS